MLEIRRQTEAPKAPTIVVVRRPLRHDWSWIEARLKMRGPWRNVKAAVGQVLIANTEWQRVSQGRNISKLFVRDNVR